MEAGRSTCSICQELGISIVSAATCGLCEEKIHASRSQRSSRCDSLFPNDLSIVVHPECSRKMSPLFRAFKNQVDSLLSPAKMHVPQEGSIHDHTDHAMMLAFRAMRPHLEGKNVIAFFESRSTELIQAVGLEAVRTYARSLYR